MSLEDCKFRIPLMTYLKMQHTDDSIDCCDTEIDAIICVEPDIYQDDEFPNLYEATCLFYSLVDVVSLNPVIVDMYGLFHHNYEIIREWVKEAWKPEYAELLETDDSGEWEYQLIECISQLISGNVGEKTAARYVKLFKQFQRVPAKPGEMVLGFAELEKENAELKARLHAVNLLTSELQKLSKAKTQQLTKAKEIIKGLLFFVDALGNYSGGIFDKAEQFLSEVEK